MSGITTAQQWKKGSEGSDLEVPSGNICLVRKPNGMRVFMKQGMIPNSLMPLVQNAINEGKGGNAAPVDPAALMDDVVADPGKLADMLSMIDAVVVDTVIQPKLYPVPEADEERDEERLYIDDVDIEDKMFIFNYAVGGVKDLESFRQQQDAALAAISDGGEVRNEAE